MRSCTCSRRSFWPVLGILGFLVLAAGEGYLYRLHQLIPDNSTAIAVLQAQVAGLQQYANRAQPAPALHCGLPVIIEQSALPWHCTCVGDLDRDPGWVDRVRPVS